MNMGEKTKYTINHNNKTPHQHITRRQYDAANYLNINANVTVLANQVSVNVHEAHCHNLDMVVIAHNAFPAKGHIFCF